MEAFVIAESAHDTGRCFPSEFLKQNGSESSVTQHKIMRIAVLSRLIEHFCHGFESFLPFLRSNTRKGMAVLFQFQKDTTIRLILFFDQPQRLNEMRSIHNRVPGFNHRKRFRSNE